MTRAEFDQQTKRNRGKPYTQWEHWQWCQYRESRCLPQPGYPAPHSRTVPERLSPIDPCADTFVRRTTRNTRILGMQMADTLNKAEYERHTIKYRTAGLDMGPPVKVAGKWCFQARDANSGEYVTFDSVIAVNVAALSGQVARVSATP